MPRAPALRPTATTPADGDSAQQAVATRVAHGQMARAAGDADMPSPRVYRQEIPARRDRAQVGPRLLNQAYGAG